MIKGELLNKLRAVPLNYDTYFASLSEAVNSGDNSKITIPDLPVILQELTPTALGKEVENATKDLKALGSSPTEELRELATPLKIGFTYIKANHGIEWAAYRKYGISVDKTENTNGQRS